MTYDRETLRLIAILVKRLGGAVSISAAEVFDSDSLTLIRLPPDVSDAIRFAVDDSRAPVDVEVTVVDDAPLGLGQTQQIAGPVIEADR